MTAVSPRTALEAGTRQPRFRLTLSTAILASMVLGIAVGIFFGEQVAFLDVIGNSFIRLLQMTILPYITASLIMGIGSLTLEKARLLAVRAGLLLLLSWVIAFFFILVLPLGFPAWESASFFSSSLVEFPTPPNFLELYIPANPFHSLSENLIPAVVLFSIAIGVAMIGIKNKEGFLADFGILCEALMRVAGFVVKLTPLGVFAIAASAAGTMSVDEFSKLQVYLILFNLACLILTFWVLPMLVAAATPFKYRDVVGLSRDALVTAFTTGNLFVVLPVLTENGKRLFAEYGLKGENTDAYVDVIIPVSFNFPNIGKLIMLVFILFAGWFSGNEMSLGDYPQFVFSGLMSFFGGVDVALPFMLDLMQVPSDMYQLYVVTGIVNGRTATLLAAMNLLAFTLLVVASLTGHLKVDWRRAGLVLVTSAGLLIGGALAARFYFETAVENSYNKDELVANMQLLERKQEALVYDVIPELSVDPDPEAPRLQRIQERGELRIGYLPGRLPFAYVNDQAQLVGLEVELAYELAKDLAVKPVFIPVESERIQEPLEQGIVDLVIGGIPVTAAGLRELTYSAPYMDVTAALLVRDYDRARFVDLETLKSIPGLTLAVAENLFSQSFFNLLIEGFPLANVVTIDSTDEFFADEAGFYDALLATAEGGSAMTLFHPSFSVVVPGPGTVSIPAAFPVAPGDQEFAGFVSSWIDLKKKDGTFQRFYDYWILGRSARQSAPRWSVIRDLLHWVE